MPLSDERKAKMQQKLNATPDALRRDPSVDYTNGWFFVTLNTREHAPVLSTCVGDALAQEGMAVPHYQYTALGERIIEIWKSVPQFHSGVVVDAFEAMPEHIHGLLFLKPENREHLGQIIKGFMIGCSHAYWDILGIDWRKGHPTGGKRIDVATSQNFTQAGANRRRPGIATPEFVDRDHSRSFRGPALFVHGYNDVEPITAEEVETKRQYIHDQARKRLIQGAQHECFIKCRHQHSRNWTTARAIRAIHGDTYFANDESKGTKAIEKITARLNDGLDLMGNKALLMRSRKLPLVCHRADAWMFDTQKAAIMKAARGGAVIVSAFISPKEREIRNLLMKEWLPFIEIVDNGFSDRYKPGGNDFYAMAENRLLQISCWSYLYQKEVKVSREMCLVMNELVKVITCTNDDWWKNL